MTIERIGVVGCGQMGAGIVEVCALAGFPVTVCEENQDAAEFGRKRILTSLDRAVSKGKVRAEDAEAALERCEFVTDLAVLATCDLVIEAIIEDETVKTELFTRLDEILPNRDQILASNTSSIPIAALAEATSLPARVVGMHFFNPVPVMPVVEVIAHDGTDETLLTTVKAFAEESLGKKVVHGPDRAGFIVNALLIPYLLSAIRFYESGLATRDDIDDAMQLGCNLPMGPLKLADFIGLDTVENIALVIFESLADPSYDVPALLHEMVEHGQLGKKSGSGFYEYS